MSSARTALVVALGVALLVASCSTGSDRPPRQAALPSVVDGATRSNGERLGDAPDDHVLEVGFGLVEPDSDLGDLVHEIASPGSATYGQHLTLTEARDRFGASPEVVDRVETALVSRGVVGLVDVTGGYVHAAIRVADAEALLGVGFGTYRTASGRTVVAPDGSVRLPADLERDVHQLVGLRSALDPGVPGRGDPVTAGRPPVEGASPSGCPASEQTGGITPAQLNDAYGLSELHEAGFTGSGARVSLFVISGFDQAALDGFTACFDLPRVVPRVRLVDVENPLAPGVEAALDAELIVAAAPDLEDLVVFETSWIDTPVFTFSAAIDPAHHGGHLPDVVATSASLCEAGLDADNLALLEHVWGIAAVTGITVVATAGDTGAAGCYPASEDPAVQYPGSSPFVTSVGGTHIEIAEDGRLVTELVWNDDPTGVGRVATGGGASALFDAPPYQEGDEAGRRTVPDVALVASGRPGVTVHTCETDGSCGWRTVGGTSMGAPYLAGAIAVLDQALASSGRPSIGLVNPLLYQMARAGRTRDLVDGHNRVLGGECCTAGPGVDQVSGVGGISFPDLLAAAERARPRSGE